MSACCLTISLKSTASVMVGGLSAGSVRHRATNVNIPECGCCGETVEGTVIRLRAEENGDKERGSRDSSTPQALQERGACCAQNDESGRLAAVMVVTG